MSVETVYLVIGANRKVRAAKRPQIRDDEVAIRIDLTYPSGWGRVVSALSIDVPDFAPTDVEVVEELDEDEATS